METVHIPPQVISAEKMIDTGSMAELLANRLSYHLLLVMAILCTLLVINKMSFPAL